MKASSPHTDERSIFEGRASLLRASALFAAALALVCVIGLAQGGGLLGWFDHLAMEWAGAARQKPLGEKITPIMLGVTRIGDFAGRMVLLALVVSILALRERYRDIAWIVALTLGIAALNTSIKLIFGAARPDLLLHLDAVHSFSFPSGHASGNMAFFLGVALLAGRRVGWIIGTALSLLIGISRLWLGVHWPSDIMAGWVEALGLLVVFAKLRNAEERASKGR